MLPIFSREMRASDENPKNVCAHVITSHQTRLRVAFGGISYFRVGPSPTEERGLVIERSFTGRGLTGNRARGNYAGLRLLSLIEMVVRNDTKERQLRLMFGNLFSSFTKRFYAIRHSVTIHASLLHRCILYKQYVQSRQQRVKSNQQIRRILQLFMCELNTFLYKNTMRRKKKHQCYWHMMYATANYHETWKQATFNGATHGCKNSDYFTTFLGECKTQKNTFNFNDHGNGI